MYIKFYLNQMEPRTVFKSPILLGTRLSGNVREELDIMRPSLLFEGNVIDDELAKANYLQIEDLDRYYFIDDIVAERQNVTRVNCHIDVLYTYRQQLLNVYGLIDRAEAYSQYNKYVNDPDRRDESLTSYVPEEFDMTGAGSLDVQSVLITVAGADPVNPGP